VLYDTIDLRDGRTWYTNLGDGPFIVALLALLATALWFARPRNPSPRPRNPAR
jgi:apolipoprotein N-acyltransferase